MRSKQRTKGCLITLAIVAVQLAAGVGFLFLAFGNKAAKIILNVIVMLAEAFFIGISPYILTILPCAATTVMYGCAAIVYNVEFREDETRETFSEEKAGEVAVAYLNEKYGEKFVAVKVGNERNGILWGDSWHYVRVEKANEQEKKEPHLYYVYLSDDTNYEILGDTVLEDYYDALYTEYAVPRLEDALEGIPFRFTVERYYPSFYSSDHGYSPDAEIPESIYDENGDFVTDGLSFKIDVADSSLADVDVDELCDRIAEYLDKDSFSFGYIYTYTDESFEKILSEPGYSTTSWHFYKIEND